MNGDKLAELQAHLRRQVSLVSRSATVEDLTRAAEVIAGGLTAEEHSAAAMLYVLRLLKDEHRHGVAGIERGSSARRHASVPIPEDDPYWQEKAARETRVRDELQAIVDDYTAQMRVDWTAELLSSTFAMPDGTLVAWGDATVEQHQARRAMFIGNAQANLEGAARHQQAIDDLVSAGVATLHGLAAAA